jgi:SAM-dependent methyltransferase
VRLLYIATGSGAVIENLFQQAVDDQPDISCVDISEVAIDSVRRRYPSVVGIVADARSIPLESSRYDFVTSQFGIEYAGLDALDEAARLIAPGGSLAMLMHIRPGLIFDECSAALDAVRRTKKAEFVERTLRFFKAGFAAVRGADRASYEKAGSKLNPAIEAVEAILSEHGEHIAGGTIAKLYGARMASMCDASVDERTFGEFGERLRNHGFTIIQGEPLLPAGDTLPIAWALRAVRTD